MNAREERNIFITMNPKELRDLADKMERRYASCRLGESTFVDFISCTTDLKICLHFDQTYFDDLKRAPCREAR